MMYRTEQQVRNAFWSSVLDGGVFLEYRGKPQNQLPTDVRCAFVDFVDSLVRNGAISVALASRVTL
jgi:hypothetical protein